MSTNPRTKAYWRRVKRIASRLRFEASYARIRREPLDLYRIGMTIDPKATSRMIEDALALAIADRKRAAEMWQRQVADEIEETERLEALVAQTRRARLRIIPGGAP